ncbi:PaaI family thioesterase [Actinomadura sp. 3N407]|uniref:PaaI family thioesterase n=1 Tax=Actinomadura sp. 3N407 TaxID=3457423 RepID=UPI003FCD6D29
MGEWDGEEGVIVHVPPQDTEGGPGVVHGGYVGAQVDEAMGLVASEVAGAPAMTRRVELDFRAPTLTQRPLTLRMRVEQERTRAVIVRLDAHQDDPAQLCFQAKGVYIKVPAAAWADQMIATDRTSEKLDFGRGDPSTYFRWQLDGFKSVYDPAGLARDVRVALTVPDVTPPSWNLAATAAGFQASEGVTGSHDATLECDFQTWQRLTHNRTISLSAAVADGQAAVTGDAAAIEALLDVLQRES